MEESEETIEKGLSNPAIDQLTLELFMNRNTYKKYISKTNPEKHEKLIEHNNNLLKYRHRILQVTIDLLDNPSSQITTEVNEIFDIYSKTLVRHFQQKDMENTNIDQRHASSDNCDDDDVLFDPESTETSITDPIYAPSSFWGKERVIKSQASISQYDMNMFKRK
jgi:hypothetical protein